MAKRPDDKIIWFDKTEGFDDKVQVIAKWINRAGSLSHVPAYDESINLSTLCNICVKHFQAELPKLSPEQLAELEATYLYHRTHKTNTTSIRLAKHTADMIEEVAKWMTEHTTVKHLHHGENINRKLILLVSIYHAYNSAIKNQQP